MQDMSEALKRAGVSAGGEVKCRQCKKPFVPKEPRHTLCQDRARRSTESRGAGRAGSWTFPPGYPSYFDDEGTLKSEYVTTLAEKTATELGLTRPKMTMHQLRAFYLHVKQQEAALENNRPLREVLLEISKLKAFARERASKEKIPELFEQFISLNVDKVKDTKTFVKGFVEHFQAVVAYCAGTIRER